MCITIIFLHALMALSIAWEMVSLSFLTSQRGTFFVHILQEVGHSKNVHDGIVAFFSSSLAVTVNIVNVRQCGLHRDGVMLPQSTVGRWAMTFDSSLTKGLKPKRLPHSIPWWLCQCYNICNPRSKKQASSVCCPKISANHCLDNTD